MMSASLGRLTILLPFVALAACAPPPTPQAAGPQAVSITTTPPGARCEAKQGEVVIARLEATPGQLSLVPSGDARTVTCVAPGHLPAPRDLVPIVTGGALMTGVLGIVESTAGTGFRYLPSMTMVLQPEVFPTAAARDAFFDGRLNDLRAGRATVMANRRPCDALDPGCPARQASADAAFAAEEARLVAARASARVAP
jgi:hypothetical protein